MGGALSGFFGGLSGYQGAFRSAFLVQAKLLPACFIGTGALIAVGVDSVRLSTYLASFGSLFAQVDLSLVGIAVGSALSAVIVGITFLHKVTNEWIQRLVILLLYLVGVGLMVGVI